MQNTSGGITLFLDLFVSDEMCNEGAAQKMKFSIKDFFSKCDQICKTTADLVTFTEEILNGKFHFLCSKSEPIGGLIIAEYFYQFTRLHPSFVSELTLLDKIYTSKKPASKSLEKNFGNIFS